MLEFVEDEKEVSMPTSSELSIHNFYKWVAMLLPFIVMVSHWIIFYVFSQNNLEVMKYPEVNEYCIAWLFIVPTILMLVLAPATYLYRRCNLFRIPFIYFICTIIERWYYGSWFCTNAMIDTHYILIYYTIGMYVILLTKLGLKYRVAPLTIISIMIKKVRNILGHNKENEDRYNRFINIMDEKKL